MTEIYFFDSYAIIEIIQGNPNYKKYEDAEIITTKLNLFEVYQSVLDSFGEQKANEFLERYYHFRIDFDLDIIMEAATMRLHHRKKNISMTDCVGYCMAKQWGVKFLTGDKEFEHFDNVEFVR